MPDLVLEDGDHAATGHKYMIELFLESGLTPSKSSFKYTSTVCVGGSQDPRVSDGCVADGMAGKSAPGGRLV